MGLYSHIIISHSLENFSTMMVLHTMTSRRGFALGLLVAALMVSTVRAASEKVVDIGDDSFSDDSFVRFDVKAQERREQKEKKLRELFGEHLNCPIDDALRCMFRGFVCEEFMNDDVDLDKLQEVSKDQNPFIYTAFQKLNQGKLGSFFNKLYSDLKDCEAKEDVMASWNWKICEATAKFE